MVASIFPAEPPPPDPRDGVNRSKFNFLEHGHVAYQIKWNHEMQQHGSIFKYFASSPTYLPPPPLTPGDGVNRLKEHGHVAYKIDCNHKM